MLVKVFAGFCFPSILPIMTCFVCTNSWRHVCPTATCLILPKPMRLAACNAAEESHRTRGVSIFNPKFSWDNFFIHTQVWAQCVKARTSASPELVAGTPACVVLFVSTTVPPKTITSPELDWRVSAQPAQSLSVQACNCNGSRGSKPSTNLLTCP